MQPTTSPSAAAPPLLHIESLFHIYNQGTAFEKTALSDINLTVNKGECVGLIGHTGSGKSTLVQHMNGLLKPSGGRVLLDGQDIHTDKKRLKQIRERIGLVFQYPEHQLFEVSVYKDVAFGPANMGLARDEIDTRVRESLALVGLPEALYEKSPFELSGGQKRRAAIAGVLAMRPDILILDEPSAGLDPAGREEILSYLEVLHKQKHSTLVLVSHSMEDVARLAGRIVILSKGRVVCEGSPAQVFAQAEMLEGIGLAAPQISMLSQRLARLGVRLPQDVFTVEAAADALAGLFI